LIRLAQVYKQINAAVGQLGLASLAISTKALESSSPNDSTYTNLENQLSSITTQRNELTAQMSSLLEGAAFNGQSINEQQVKHLVSDGQALLNQVNSLAS